MNIQNDLKIFQIASKVLTHLKIKRLKFSVVSWFSIMAYIFFRYGIKRRPGNAGNQQKAFEIRKKPLLTVIITRQQLKKRTNLLFQYHFCSSIACKTAFKPQW